MSIELKSGTPTGDIATGWERHKFDIKVVNPANKRKYTVKGGDYRSRESNVYRLAQLSVNIIDQAAAQGVPFAREYGGMLANRSFGGALISRTFYAKGQTRRIDGQPLLHPDSPHMHPCWRRIQHLGTWSPAMLIGRRTNIDD